MNVNHAELKLKIYGGAKSQTVRIYCGDKPNPPKGKVRGRSNQCFMSGRRAGFAAGIQEGLKQGMAKAKVTRAIHQRQPRAPAPAAAPAPELPVLQSLPLGVLRDMLRRHLDANPELPREYRLTSGMYSGQMKGVAYIGKPDYIIILRRYGLGR